MKLHLLVWYLLEDCNCPTQNKLPMASHGLDELENEINFSCQKRNIDNHYFLFFFFLSKYKYIALLCYLLQGVHL